MACSTAVENNQLATLVHLRGMGAGLNNFLIIEAARCRNTDMLRQLVGMGLNTEAVDYHGNTQLI